MKRFEITCAAVLVCLFMGNSVLAQEEKQGRSVTAPAFGSSRSGDLPTLRKLTSGYITMVNKLPLMQALLSRLRHSKHGRF